MDTKQFVASRRIRATAKLVESNQNMTDMPVGSTHWRVTLSFRKHSMTVPFSMGPALCREPNAADVLDCLLSDACGYDNSNDFDDWCAEYGYDSDSRKHERIYQIVERQTSKLKRFLGGDYDIAMNADRL